MRYTVRLCARCIGVAITEREKASGGGRLVRFWAAVLCDKVVNVTFVKLARRDIDAV